jgi:hypothetical protein
MRAVARELVAASRRLTETAPVNRTAAERDALAHEVGYLAAALERCNAQLEADAAARLAESLLLNVQNVLSLAGGWMTYICNYCGTGHADETNSDEHIIPEKLLNSSLVLPDVCRRWNNLFARDFENAVMSSDFLRDVLLQFTERSRGVKYLGTVETARGTTEHRWLVDGDERLRDMPEPERVEVMTVDAFDDQNQRHPVQVRLPFKVTEKFRGDDTALADERKKIEKQQAKLFDYLSALASDPSKNPELQKQLEERGLHLRAPKSVSFDETMSVGSVGGVVDDILPKEHQLDGERWTKFYMKIAWCFACLKLGRSQLVGIGGEPVLGYLRSGLVDPLLVDEVRKQDRSIAVALFRDATIDGEVSWLWNGTVDEARQQLVSAPPGVIAKLGPVLQSRSEAHRSASTWMKASAVLERVSGAEHRYHELRLQRVIVAEQMAQRVVAEQTALVCEIQLFGGICVATVQLTPLLPMGALDDVEEVNFMIQF